MISEERGAPIVLSPLVPLVGREAELAVVSRALDGAADGAAQVVSLVGDAGVGKSRVVEEGLTLGRARGFLTLHAVASPLHADLHYGVVVEALRPVVRTIEAGARTRLVEGLPDLGRLFDGLDLPTPSPLGDAGMERTRLFESVVGWRVRQPDDRGLGFGHVTVGPAIEQCLHQNTGRRNAPAQQPSLAEQMVDVGAAR